MLQIEQDRLIVEYSAVAKRIALKLARRCPPWVGRDDLVSAGLLGLIEAARRFDGSRAAPFLPYAEQRIRGAVLDELRCGDMLPRRVRQNAHKIAAAIHVIENNGQTATEEKVADQLGVSVDDYRDNLATLLTTKTESIDGEAAMLLVDKQQTPVEHAERSQRLTQLRAALGRLKKRHVTLLGLYYIEEMTFREIGTTVEISASRVCQLVARSIAQLRVQLADEAVPAAA